MAISIDHKKKDSIGTLEMRGDSITIKSFGVDICGEVALK
jgi:hypothetical protein